MLSGFFRNVLNSRKWLLFLTIINAIGFLYGVYFYWNQLMATPFYLWIFVVDSPLPVLLMSIVSGLLLFGKKNTFLIFFTSVGLVKYGFWTVLVLSLFREQFYAASPLIYSMNLPLHIGMIIEGIALLYIIKPKIVHAVIPLVFFLINDTLDYFFGTLPIIPSGFNNLLVYEAFLSTLIIIGAVFYFSKNFNYGKTN